MVRTFIAIDLDAGIKEYLAVLQNKLKFGAGTKASPAKGFHLTLKFLGEINEIMLKKVDSALAEIKFRSFEIMLKNIGVFPSSGKPRVVWVGINHEKELLKLQNRVELAMAELGFAKEKAFKPHITLARIKYTNDITLRERLLSIKTEQMSQNVNSFVLFRSTLTRHGAVYTKINEYFSS